MSLLNTRSVLSLLGLAVLALLAGRTAAQMPEIFVPTGTGVPQVPGDDSYTYRYSVWGEPKQEEQPPNNAAPAYEYRPVAVCPWETVTDPRQYRPEGRAPVAQAAAVDVFGRPAAK